MKIWAALLGGVGALALTATAHATTISSYTQSNVPASGYGGWSYTSTTLSDGLIPNDANNNLLLDLTLSPSINFTLSGLTAVSSFDVLSNYLDNNIPGNLQSVTITIGGVSEVLNNVSYGAMTIGGYPVDGSFTLTGAIAHMPTTTFTLSNFVADGRSGFPDNTALGEVVVNGTQGAVPEPATWAMMLMGFGLMGFGLRNRRKAVRVTYA